MRPAGEQHSRRAGAPAARLGPQQQRAQQRGLAQVQVELRVAGRRRQLVAQVQRGAQAQPGLPEARLVRRRGARCRACAVGVAAAARRRHLPVACPRPGRAEPRRACTAPQGPASGIRSDTAGSSTPARQQLRLDTPRRRPQRRRAHAPLAERETEQAAAAQTLPCAGREACSAKLGAPASVALRLRVRRRGVLKPAKPSWPDGDAAPSLSALSPPVSIPCAGAGLVASSDSRMFSLLRPEAMACRREPTRVSDASKPMTAQARLPRLHTSDR